MLFSQVALTLCLVLLFFTRMSAFTAARRGDGRQVRVLRFFQMGLNLSAISYLFRLAGAPPANPLALLSALCCFSGTLLIWVGWMEYWHLQRERLCSSEVSQSHENDDGTAVLADTDSPRLNSRTQRLMSYAQDEARRQRQGCVDTDHLLLGLLRDSGGAGTHILDRLCVKQEHLHLALGHPTPSHPLPQSPAPDQPLAMEPLPLTNRARQTLTLAAQEAHRFDRNSVGTDHLLLGLVLMGRGAAAAALFSEGVTVDGIRGEVLKQRMEAR